MRLIVALLVAVTFLPAPVRAGTRETSAPEGADLPPTLRWTGAVLRRAMEARAQVPGGEGAALRLGGTSASRARQTLRAPGVLARVAAIRVRR